MMQRAHFHPDSPDGTLRECIARMDAPVKGASTEVVLDRRVPPGIVLVVIDGELEGATP